jgi:outer membrane biosynthesis protein TonB
MGVKLSEIRWEAVGKLAAGLLLAVAIVVSAPSLLGGEKPAPLPPDVGLPQAAPPVAVAPEPPPTKPRPKRKPKRKPKPARKPKRDRPAQPPEPEDDPSPASAAPIVAALPPPSPPGTYEDFGFERP